LEAKARDILKSIGYPEEPIDSVFGFQTNSEYLDDVERNNQSAHRYDNLPALAVQFWYRQSSRPLGLVRSSGIWQDSPASINRGSSGVMLDSRGSLIKLWVIPAEASESSGAEQPPDFSALFKAAGIDQEECKEEKDPDWKYLPYDYDVDTRKAWTGTLPDNPDIPIRIDAAARGGKPVAWFLTAPYRNDTSNPDAASSTSIDTDFIVIAFLIIIVVGGGPFFALRNLRMGRGDRRGAARLARFVFGLVMVQWLFGVHYIAASNESTNFSQAVSSGLFSAVLMWLMYIALEPFVRRRWPSLLVGWSRALAGDYRDSLVGRDLLIGCGAGVVWAMAYYLRFPLSQWFGIPGRVPSSGIGLETFYVLTGGRAIIVAIADAILQSVTVALLTGFIFFLVRMLFRNTWVAVAVTVLLIGALIISGESSYITAIPTVLAVGVGCFLFFRLGFLAVVAEIISLHILGSFPITLHLSAWYSWIGLTGLALLLALALYAFRTSLGGRPMFGTPRLDD
jgi:serine/threonine-protein kinase